MTVTSKAQESRPRTAAHPPRSLPPIEDRAYWRAIAEEDRTTLWHPYTSMLDPLPTYVVRQAAGVRLQLDDGRWLVDGMSSWWAAIHGYRVPELDAAVRAQVDVMSHVMFGGITHAPAVELARSLQAILPEGMEHIFYADSGSVSVEVAIKVAIQYQMAKGRSARGRMMAFRGGYHGDTTGAMALCDPDGGMHSAFRGVLVEHLFAPKPRIAYGAPWDPAEGEKLRRFIDEHAEELAAVFIEPIVQGAGGMWMYHPEYLRVVREACTAHDILLIADEIATGFGRTGTLWGCDHAQIVPDVMCIGKALTGGYMTLAAMITTQEVAMALADSPSGVLMHGPTFMGNPLAVSVARASVDLFAQGPWKTRVRELEATLDSALSACREFTCVKDVRVLGAIGVVEVHKDVNVAELQKVFVTHGAWIRPFRNLIYIMPPYVMRPEDIQILADAICAGLQTLETDPHAV